MITTAQVRLLKTAQRTLHIEDEDWRALLKAEAGVESSTQLDNVSMSRVMKRLTRLGFSTARTRPTQDSMIADFYAALGWNSLAQRTGFNRHCCGKLQPQTKGEKSNVIIGLERMMERETIRTLAELRARCRA